MIHFSRIMQINERLREIESELECGFSAEVETNLFYEQTCLWKEREELEAEEDEWRDGYNAGWEFHLGSGRYTENPNGSKYWDLGFTMAGEDS